MKIIVLLGLLCTANVVMGMEIGIKKGRLRDKLNRRKSIELVRRSNTLDAIKTPEREHKEYIDKHRRTLTMLTTKKADEIVRPYTPQYFNDRWQELGRLKACLELKLVTSTKDKKDIEKKIEEVSAHLNKEWKVFKKQIVLEAYINGKEEGSKIKMPI
jgi:hypothetical protein